MGTSEEACRTEPPREICGPLGDVTKRDHRLSILRRALNAVRAKAAPYGYRPEKHYMRGPGPKTLSKIGEALRAETAIVTREPIPQRWLELLHSIEKRQRDS
jgi:hypothetical protein